MQILNTNQCLGASTVDFKAWQMLDSSIWAGHVDPGPPKLCPITNEDEDGDDIDDCEILSEVELAKEPSMY